MKRLMLAALMTFTAYGAPASADDIPKHPSQLRYPPLRYQAPVAADYRTVIPGAKVPAYLAVDHTRPLVTISITYRVGDYLDPKDRPGVAELAGYLMTRGGVQGKLNYSADALEERLEFLAANLQSGNGEVNGEVSLNLLTKDLDEGLAILRDVLTAPRFQADKLALRKDQLLAEMKRRNDSSTSIEARERAILSFGADHFSTHELTKAELQALTRADLVAFHRRYIHPRNFIVWAAGDFDKGQLVHKLDALFAGWPYPGEAVPTAIPAPRQQPQKGVYLVDKPDVTQGRVSILLPGLRRDDPDYYATQVMNDVLGGGGFTSRITNRVRSDEGLAYAVGSRLPGGVYYPLTFTATFQSKPRTCAYAASIILEEMKRLRESGAKDEELQVARRQLADALPRFFPNAEAVARTLANEELTGRYAVEPEYFRHYAERIEAVTKAQVDAAARKWLKPEEVTILAVGKKADLLNADPTHPASFAQLLPGVTQVTELPLRDPLTMKPLPQARAAK